MKVLVDMNLSPRLATLLSDAGFESVHWSQVGLATDPDLAIMVHAKLHDFVVLTHDLDFGAILAATNADKPSVVQIRASDLKPEALVGPVTIGLRQCEVALTDGALLTIDVVRLRLRLLPLKRA
jgi:predicted nuclease of predicted toxin-antitoxin system